MSVRLMRLLARALLGAMLLATLAPGISRSLASLHVAGDWVEVCSSAGMHWVRLEAAGAQGVLTDVGELAHALNDCGHCNLAAERFAPLIPGLPAVADLSGHRFLPRPIALAALSCAAPQPAARGPPFLI